MGNDQEQSGMINTPAEDAQIEAPSAAALETRRAAPSAAAPAAARPPTHVSPLRVYKPGQGATVRWGSAVGFAVVALGAADFLYSQMPLLPGGENLLFRTLVPVGLLVVAAYFIFYFVGRARGAVDFMIATEGEMKKVSWSSKKEVFGATKVVIVTLLALGTILFVVDLFFMLFFSSVGVLRVDVLSRLLQGPES